ncbi:MAG: hypothetical protein AB8G99_03460 [Planctomycetaceae bacterium]
MTCRHACLSIALILSVASCDVVAQESASDVIHVKQIDGVWWFINADGEKFVSIGVNHIEPHLWLAPYNKVNTLKNYGSDMVDDAGHFNTHGKAATKWINRQVEITKDLGFNTFGKHVHPAIDPKLYQEQVYYIASLETAPLAGWRERKGQGPRPDVFSLDFRAYVEKKIKIAGAQHKDSRNLIGYLYSDVPSWILGRGEQRKRGNTTMVYPWATAILELGEASPGKQRWLRHLATRYKNAEAVATVWNLPISPTYGVSWDDLARQIDWTKPTDARAAKADMLAFMPIIVEQWYSLHKQILRRHDPNHLILGDKNMTNWHHDWLLPSLKRHVDVICVQGYGRWADEAKLYERIYKATGKPIFNGDGCYGLADDHQQEWGVKGFRTGAKSLEDVANMYEETMTGMMQTPYVVGWHHCGYLQQWDASERGDSPRNENGFLDPMETYRTVLTRKVKAINLKAHALHQ